MRYILFADGTCPKPYTGHTLRTEALGGTEATVIRVAEALAQDKTLVVSVLQRGRDHDEHVNGVHYLGDAPNRADVVINLRMPNFIKGLRKKYPSCKLYFWLHDITGDWLRTQAAVLAAAHAEIICVSDWHADQTSELIAQAGLLGHVLVRRIYNPVDLIRNNLQPYERNKLLFFSSPHKGLARTLSVFSKFQDFPELKDMMLYTANPGYYPDAVHTTKNVVNLGPLPHAEIIRHLRSAFCVFHLNTVFPETFGIVYAEAQAVGTPFLTARLAAVPEISSHDAQFVDVKDDGAVIERLLDWRRNGTPEVTLKDDFKLSTVMGVWHNLIR